MVLKHAYLSSVPDLLRSEVLRRVWRRAGWPEGGMSARRWRRLAALVRAKEVPRTEIGAGVTMATENVFLVLWRTRPVPVSTPISGAIAPTLLEVPGAVVVPWAGGRLVATCDAGESAGERLDFDRVVLPLSIRAGAGRPIRAAGHGWKEHAPGRLPPGPARAARPTAPALHSFAMNRASSGSLAIGLPIGSR